MIKENDGLFYHEFIKSIKKRFNTHFDKNKHVIVHGIKGDMHDYIVKIRIEAGANHSSVLINFVYFDDLIKMMDCKYNFADLLAREVQSIENDLMKTFNLVNPYYDQDHDINFDQVVGEMVVFYKKLNEMLKICLKLIPKYAENIDILMKDFVDDVIANINSTLLMSVSDQIFLYYNKDHGR